MILARTGILLATLAFCNFTNAGEYRLYLDVTKESSALVRLDVSTNIPGTIEVMASINLSEQKPKDTYIGKSKRLKVVNGKVSVQFDVSDLPTAKYFAEVAFYPRWGFADDTARETDIQNELSVRKKVNIAGSGESRKHAEAREVGQKWVIENVSMGMEWRPKFWTKKFGDWTESPSRNLNPTFVKDYYFEKIDMTIVVNTLQNRIVTWRMGEPE